MDDSSVLYYEAQQIDTSQTEVTIKVSQKPRFVAVDPYGTRTDKTDRQCDEVISVWKFFNLLPKFTRSKGIYFFVLLIVSIVIDTFFV